MGQILTIAAPKMFWRYVELLLVTYPACIVSLGEMLTALIGT